MRRFRWAVALGLLAVLSLCSGRTPGAELGNDSAGQIKVVKYPQLGEVIKKNRGKVVVVDFWNIY
jgi:hypothetical protein